MTQEHIDLWDDNIFSKQYKAERYPTLSKTQDPESKSKRTAPTHCLASMKVLGLVSSVMPFSFNAVASCFVTINEKPWAMAREVCKALEYNKKTAHIIKAHVSSGNYAQNYQMSSVPAALTPINCLKDSQKHDIHTNEKGMYELLFSSQHPKAKNFRRHYFNVLFPHVRQQISDKSHAMEIEGLTSRVQALKITNEAHQ